MTLNRTFISIVTDNVLYVGCTEDLKKRIYFHKKRLIPGFTKKYSIDQLIYFEGYVNHDDALAREVQIEKYRRDKKKSALVQKKNFEWIDQHYETIYSRKFQNVISSSRFFS